MTLVYNALTSALYNVWNWNTGVALLPLIPPPPHTWHPSAKFISAFSKKGLREIIIIPSPSFFFGGKSPSCSILISISCVKWSKWKLLSALCTRWCQAAEGNPSVPHLIFDCCTVSVVIPMKWMDCSSCGLWATFGEAGHRNWLSLHSVSTTSRCSSRGRRLQSGERLKSFKQACVFNMFGTRWHCFICDVYVKKQKATKNHVFFLNA